MKNIILKISLLAIILLTVACEDFLVKEPPLEQTSTLTLSTYAGLDASTLGAYTPFYGTNWYGRNFVITADLKGGNAKLSPISSGRFTTEYLWNNTAAATSGLWGSAYTAIARANNVINALDGFTETGVTQDDLDHLEAECLFIRALSYFDLCRIYAQPYAYAKSQTTAAKLGVPIVLVTEQGEPARDDLTAVYDRIVTDLKDAESLFGSYVREGVKDPAGVASKAAAQALLARVYLYMEDWQKAADYATKLTSNNAYKLYSSDEFTTIGDTTIGVWGQDLMGSEVIFGIYGSEGNTGHGNWDAIPYILSPDGYGDVGASKDLYDLYEDDDVRKALFTNTTDWQNNYWSTKYYGKAASSPRIRNDNIPVLRLSEMYLIRAEAIINGATIAGVSAAADVNAIRSKRGATDYTAVGLQSVYNERRMELCFEGHELFDLARTERSLERTDFDGANNEDILFPNYRWAFAIPRSEQDANTSIIPNPGY